MSRARETELHDGPEQKVLKRALVSKMARALQDRLALANVKIKFGWQDRSIQSIGLELEQELKRKRTVHNHDALSDSASSTSGGRCFSHGAIGSSPMTAPVFSDDIDRSGSTHASSRKRTKMLPLSSHARPASASRTRQKRRTADRTVQSWKRDFQLPQSSPIAYQEPIRPTFAALENNDSFLSSASTIMNSPSASEDDDQDLPLHSFQVTSSHLSSSPPRTPSPTLARSARFRSRPHNASSPPLETLRAGKEGADLLLYLATSPSPAMRITRNADMFPPSTPPSKNILPSSMMSTPGTQMFMGFGGPQTPNAAPFDFGAFVNITPSPAQRSWQRTPKTPANSKTPIVYREARRKLTFEAMPPPQPIPSAERTSTKKDAGLGMELGGNLISP